VTAPVRGLIAALGAFVTVAGCGRPSPHSGVATPAPSAASTSKAAKALPDNVAIAVTSHKIGSQYILLTVRKHNRKSYDLRADSESGRYVGQDSGTSTFVNPHVTFYAADGKHVVADAPAGTVVEKDKTVLMSGGVHARTQDGTTLTSDTLRYDDEDQMAHGEGHVVVTSPEGETLQGDTLDWNLRDGRINVAGAR
jgi:LPS export ABC transporter protein LptC